jgi:hypothetical protein
MHKFRLWLSVWTKNPRLIKDRQIWYILEHFKYTVTQDFFTLTQCNFHKYPGSNFFSFSFQKSGLCKVNTENPPQSEKHWEFATEWKIQGQTQILWFKSQGRTTFKIQPWLHTSLEREIHENRHILVICRDLNTVLFPVLSSLFVFFSKIFRVFLD